MGSVMEPNTARKAIARHTYSFFNGALCCLLSWLMAVPLVWAVETAPTLSRKTPASNPVFKLAPEIYDVKGMGNWTSGNQSGQIRLVITRTNRRDEVYLQWVSWDDFGPKALITSVPVDEINLEAPYKTLYIRKETVRNEHSISLGLEDRHTKQIFKATIKTFGIGKYDCKIH